MAKIRSKRIFSTDRDYLKTIQEEYESIGFDTRLSKGVLVVYALKRKPKKKKAEGEEKHHKSKREKKFERRS